EDAALVQTAIRAVQAEREATILLTLAPQVGSDVGVAEAALAVARAETDRAIGDAGLSRELDESPRLLIRPVDEPPSGDASGTPPVRSAMSGDARAGVNQPTGGQSPQAGGQSTGGQSPQAGGQAFPGGGQQPVRGGTPGGADQADRGQQPADGSGAYRATDLTLLRGLVDEGTVESGILFASYSNFVGQYQEHLFESARLGDGSLLSASIVSYEQWQQAIEWFAQVRVAGFQRLVSYDLAGWQRLARLSDSEELFLQLAQQSAQPAESAALAALLEDPGVLEGAAARRLLLNAREGPPLISTQDWLEQTGARLDALNAGADFLLANGIEQAEAAEAVAERDLRLIAAATALLMLLVTFGAWVVTRSISRPLHRLALTAQLASAGQLIEVDVPRSHDAIGEIGSAIDELRRRSDDMADAASDIARGDLTTEIQPRSGHDRLGWALRAMTQRLGTMVEESEQRSEQLAGEVDVLQETAHQDVLTGLANRRKFAQQLEAGIAGARTEGSKLGLLFIDLDGFKPINDRLGHDVGDELLRRVAARLTVVVGQAGAVGRYGGDEFTVVVNAGVEQADDHVAVTARRISEALSMPYEIEGRTVQLGSSIGISQWPDHGESAGLLLRAADQAMYEAKESGGGIRLAPAPEAAA
ncbi:MAG: diguanylate cyclase, partial [Dehalococcoidia bacterium]|nr:diguanylate cyclase [Dehalococcoidia bacterium]